MMLFCQFVNSEYICTYIDEECIVEFGDFGKAPNQYATEVGDLNVISSDIVTQLDGRTFLIQKQNKEQGDETQPD